MNVVRLGVWLALLCIIFLPLERLLALRPRRFFSKALVQDVAYYFINGLIPSLLLAVPLAFTAMGIRALVPASMQSAVAAWPLWERIVAGMIVGEIGFYWGHRWAHKIPLLWRFHAIHHSAEKVFFLTSSRAHPIDNVFIRLCGLIPAYVLGVASPLTPNGTLVPVIVVLVATVWGFFIHANMRIRLGPLEWLVATPAFHHWHHTNSAQRDCNYASMLPWIDRLFDTHHLPKEWPSEYGIDEQLPESLAGQLLYPLRPATPVPATKPIATDA